MSHTEEQIIWYCGGRVAKPTAADWAVSPVLQLQTLKGVDLETDIGNLAEVTLLLPKYNSSPFLNCGNQKTWPSIEGPISLWGPS